MNGYFAAIFWALAIMLIAPYGRKWIVERFFWLESWLALQLESFHIFINKNAVRSALVTFLGAWLAIGWIFSPSALLVPLVVFSAVIAVIWLVRRRVAVRYRLLRTQLPSVIELLATTLRAGLSVRAALVQVARQAPAPISQELAVVDRMQRIGLSVQQALGEWSKKTPIPEIELLSFAIGVSTSSGGNLADTLDQLAATFRQRLVLEDKVDALTAQGRLQAKVMIALPLLLAFALTAIDPVSMSALWFTTSGHFVLIGIGVLELIGLLWIRKLIRIDF